MELSILIPLQTKSEANQSEHWRVKAARVKSQKDWIKLALLQKGKVASFQLPAIVTFTRYGPRLLDSDNLAGAFKAVRDAVATWLGCGDSPSDPVTWEYQQFSIKTIQDVPGTSGWDYAIRIEVKSC